MNSSVVAAIPFSSFISIGIVRLNQLSKKVNAESLDFIFEDLYYENESRKMIPVFVNNQKVMDIELETNLNINRINVAITSEVVDDITKFKSYLEKVDIFKENPNVVEYLKQADNGFDIGIVIDKRGGKYVITYFAIINGKHIDAGIIEVSAKVEDTTTDNKEEIYALINKLVELHDQFIDFVLKHRKYFNIRIKRKLDGREYDVSNLTEELKYYNEKIKEANTIEEKLEYLKKARRIVFIFYNLGDIVKIMQWSWKRYNSFYRKLRLKTIKYDKTYQRIRNIVMLFLKPFMILSRQIKNAILRVLDFVKRLLNRNKKTEEQLPSIDNTEIKTDAKILANYIARFEYYSIVYENSLIGKISSIISNIIQFIKKAATKSYEAIKDLLKWITVNALKLLSAVLSATINILQKSNNVVKQLIDRFNKSNT